MLVPFMLLSAFLVHKATSDKSYKGGDPDVGGITPRRRSTMLSHTRG